MNEWMIDWMKKWMQLLPYKQCIGELNQFSDEAKKHWNVKILVVFDHFGYLGHSE